MRDVPLMQPTNLTVLYAIINRLRVSSIHDNDFLKQQFSPLGLWAWGSGSGAQYLAGGLFDVQGTPQLQCIFIFSL